MAALTTDPWWQERRKDVWGYPGWRAAWFYAVSVIFLPLSVPVVLLIAYLDRPAGAVAGAIAAVTVGIGWSQGRKAAGELIDALETKGRITRSELRHMRTTDRFAFVSSFGSMALAGLFAWLSTLPGGTSLRSVPLYVLSGFSAGFVLFGVESILVLQAIRRFEIRTESKVRMTDLTQRVADFLFQLE